jgi:hypothetical protein
MLVHSDINNLWWRPVLSSYKLEAMSVESPPNKSSPGAADLETAVAALSKDYSRLSPRIRVLTHSVTCKCAGVVLRLHFPAFRQGKPTIFELVDAISHELVHFALPRSQVAALKSQHNKISADEFMLKNSQLIDSAKSLFIQANKATNRNGEAGELLLYLLTEWILAAPQIIAKMSLKTNSAMPVHGADGVHVRYSKKDKRLFLYWGESKLHANVGDAITAGAKSIVEALKPDKIKHEIDLVQRNIDFSGMGAAEKAAFLRYLDPFSEDYNERHDVTTCLIGFDFDGFATVAKSDPAKAESEFVELAKKRLQTLGPTLAKAFTAAGLDKQPMEIFFFPVPSVKDLRDTFQQKIGWKQ